MVGLLALAGWCGLGLLAALALTLAVWTLRLWLGILRRGDVPPYGHPEPVPLPDYAIRDLSGPRRLRRFPLNPSSGTCYACGPERPASNAIFGEPPPNLASDPGRPVPPP